MTPQFNCELNYFESMHLSQIYSGFELLKEAGIVKISFKSYLGDASKPILKVNVNNKYNIIYDTLDGLNWIDGTIEENLNYFRNNIKADYYFKRSFNKQVADYAPKNCSVHPLGFNYVISPKQLHKRNILEKFKNTLKNNFLISKYFEISKTNIYSGNFEFYPIPNKINKILLLTRLWNPSDVNSERLKSERESINNYRVSCIKRCQKEFKQYFVGGLHKDSFSILHCKDLVMPSSLTRRDVYLNAVKESNICIANTGLHYSIGFKMAEYVAASRAIVSEPLHFEIPGKFEDNGNYLSFNNVDELLEKINLLITDKSALCEMMNNNFQYYNNFLRPDILVLNTLLQVIQND